MTYQETDSSISSEFLKRSFSYVIEFLDIILFMQLLESDMSQKNKYIKTKYLSSFIQLYLAIPLSKSSLFTLTNVDSNTFILFGKDLFMLANKEDYFDFCINDMASPIFWAREYSFIYS